MSYREIPDWIDKLFISQVCPDWQERAKLVLEKDEGRRVFLVHAASCEACQKAFKTLLDAMLRP